MNHSHVRYEDFGAVGDGVSDDLPAICKAHAHANEHRLPVLARPDAAYHLGGRKLTATIATDTDWNTARFLIDDTQAEDNKHSLFEVRSLLEPFDLQINKLHRDQRSLEVRPKQSCFVLVEDDGKRIYIRRGLNQNDGVPQQDCFILHPDGSVEGDIDWHYDRISRIVARPIEEQQLLVQGGVFSTTANRMRQEQGYNYWSRNIKIFRSNTIIDGLTHYVVGETAVGHPYCGFLSAERCANITLRDCFVTPHKIYQTIGSAGEPVNMGSYDLHANSIVNLNLINCRMNHILDRTRWGVIGSNFCKNILLDGCVLSRMDTHMGVSGFYVIRNCSLGHMGLNAIGRGLLRLEDSTFFGSGIVTFRGDYGSTWEGTVEVSNCHWTPSCGEQTWPHMFATNNDGMHDFGYPCFMPQTLSIDGLHIEDTQTPEDYTGPYIFTDPGDLFGTAPFPYQACQKVSISNLTTASGKTPQISPNSEFSASVELLLES